MQKTEKAPKRSEVVSGADAETTQLKENIPNLTMATADDFKEHLLKTTQDYITIAKNANDTTSLEVLTHSLTGLQFCFDKLHIDPDQLIGIAQGGLSVLDHSQKMLEKDYKVQNDSTLQLQLETAHSALMEMHPWLSSYQSKTAIFKKIPAMQTPLPPPSPTLQQLINALNVTTVSAFLIALQNLNQFFVTNPSIPITWQQFSSLFDQLDLTFLHLPEQAGPGLSQRQVIASMIAINRQVNQLYGFLMGQQILSV